MEQYFVCILFAVVLGGTESKVEYSGSRKAMSWISKVLPITQRGIIEGTHIVDVLIGTLYENW